ncbi:hypothetical protein TRIP_C60276 [Candidatus Zixiibacteriota bacterium]|nr:hypothetical protein TRIP_C60276 [candidate division Zixibacteria bacterium]
MGGSSDESPAAVAVNSSGEIFVCGTTSSSNFPLMTPYDNTYQGTGECFLTKFNVSGTSLAFSTYFGGSGYDACNDLSITNSFGIFLTGTTLSADFPTYYAVDPTLGGSDAFITSISYNGNAINFSTFLGGAGSEAGTSIAIGCVPPCITTSFRVWVTGNTSSSDFPVLNAYSTNNNGMEDAFLTEYAITPFFPPTISMLASTYFGGSNYDYPNSIFLQGGVKPYIAGYTESSNFPTVNAYDNTLKGTTDAFMAGFAFSGNGALYPTFSTYFGGNEDPSVFEEANAILINGAGNIIMAGTAGSYNLATHGVIDSNYLGPGDAFIAEFNNTGTNLLFCTYLGSAGQDYLQGPKSLALDATGNLYVAGATGSPGFPMVDPIDSTQNINTDGFLAKLNPTATQLLFSTFLGGNNTDIANAVAVDQSACAYVVGATSATDFPMVSPYDGSPNGGKDAFLVKICLPNILCGDVNASGTVNILDVSYIINYLYKSGPAPNPLQTADVNNSGGVNILDVSYLINYLYKSGPAPHCP